jgi:hypothetical protein
VPKLRLIKVIVQPVFVLDDGENVTEIEHPAVTIPAAEWPAYSGERFPAEVKAWQQQLDAEAKSEPSKLPRTQPKR